MLFLILSNSMLYVCRQLISPCHYKKEPYFVILSTALAVESPNTVCTHSLMGSLGLWNSLSVICCVSFVTIGALKCFAWSDSLFQCMITDSKARTALLLWVHTVWGWALQLSSSCVGIASGLTVHWCTEKSGRRFPFHPTRIRSEDNIIPELRAGKC